MRRPINPVIPYPHEAIQHTRCVLALSMITVAISFLKPEMLAQLGDLGRQVEKVNRWIERCADDTQKRGSPQALNEIWMPGSISLPGMSGTFRRLPGTLPVGRNGAPGCGPG